MRWISRLVAFFAALTVVFACLSDRVVAAPCGVAADAGGEFQTTSLEQAGLDPAILCSLDENLNARNEANVHAVVVLRNGRLVFETYRKGDDWMWGTKLGEVTYTPAKLHDTRSVSKSVVSLLVGVALDRKLIASVDERVFSYFPEYEEIKTPEKDAITLRDLLTMTAGLGANENVDWYSPINTEREMYQSADPYRDRARPQALEQAGRAMELQQRLHNASGCGAAKGNRQAVEGLAKEALFDPLGIKEFEWITVLPSDEPAAGGGLRLRPRDMAKIGQLVLNKGEWNGHPVVSASWIMKFVQSRYTGWGSRGYGYQWWTGASNIGGKTYQWTAAWGLGGQRIFIVPELNLVVAVTAGMYRSGPSEGVAMDVFEDFVLVSVRD